MFGLIKKAFFTGLTILSSVNPLNTTPLKCVSMNNQKCKIRPEMLMVIVMSLYFILLVLKQVKAVVVAIISIIPGPKCVFLMLLKTNVKVFNLTSRTNETRHIKWHETC